MSVHTINTDKQIQGIKLHGDAEGPKLKVNCMGLHFHGVHFLQIISNFNILFLQF